MNGGLVRSVGTLRSGAVGLALVALLGAAPGAHAGAKLESARWRPDAPENAGASVSEDGQTITTPLAGRTPGRDAEVGGRLFLDTKYGEEIDLSFLTDVPWVTCEAPKGLRADAEGHIDFVCRARARGLDPLAETLRVYVKVDPTGGLAHRKLYWVLEPGD